jgi:hypothetical protein
MSKWRSDRRAVVFRRAGLGWIVAFGVLGTLFIGGETIADPGGWEAAGLVSAWIVPMAAGCVLAWFRPGIALPVLVVLLAGALVLSTWHWRAGPVDAIALFAVSISLGSLGWHRPGRAGLLLLAEAVLAGVLSPGGSVAAAAIPAGVAGLLYLLGASFEPKPASHSPARLGPDLANRESRERIDDAATGGVRR